MAAYFQRSLDTHVIPDMWKTSYVIPLSKKSGAEESGDFRPIAITPVIMKTLENIVVKQLLKLSVECNLDTCQFAY